MSTPLLEDIGCSMAGRAHPPTSTGHCPVRGTPCVQACLLGTIDQMKKTLETHAADAEVMRLLGRNDGLTEAAALARSVGSKSVARAIDARIDPHVGRTVARAAMSDHPKEKRHDA